MDRFASLVSSSQVAIAIFGNPALDQFEFKEITSGSMCLTRCAGFVGIVGVSGFATRTAFAVEVDNITVTALSQAVAKILEEAICRVERTLKIHAPSPDHSVRGREN